MKLRVPVGASLLAALAAILIAAQAQDSSGPLTPREMYYHRDDTPQATATQPSTAKATTSHRHNDVKTQATTAAADSGSTAPAAATTQPVSAHTVAKAAPAGGPEKTGIRYTVVLMGSDGAHDASDDQAFHSGDCVQLRVESNKSGYLYVLHHGPDGNWQPLMPSPKMPDEDNRIRAFKTMQIPVKYCFQFDDKPGVETLFVAVAGSADAMPNLRRAIVERNQSGAGDEGGSGPTMMALNHQVDALRGRGMDIMQVQKVVEKPQSGADASGNTAHAVYIVNTSDSNNDHVVAEVRLRHE